jgi:hypothetical protein
MAEKPNANAKGRERPHQQTQPYGPGPRQRKERQMKPWILALGMSVAYAQAVIKPCDVTDTACQSAQQVQAYQTLHPEASATFTATAVLTDSCTICGKSPQ